MADRDNDTTPDPMVAAVEKQISSGQMELPDNFDNVEDFVKSYRSMQAFTSRTAEDNARLREKLEKPDSDEAADEADSVDSAQPVEDIGAVLDPKPANLDKDGGIDWDALQDELARTGDLSEQTRLALSETHKVPDGVIDQYVRSYKLEVKAEAEAAAEMVGGQENLNAILQWAKENKDPKQVLEALRQDRSGLVLRGLEQEWRQSTKPAEPSGHDIGQPGGPSTEPLKPYTSKQEMFADMGDIRYVTDPAFRQRVQNRLRLNAGVDPASVTDNP